MKLKVTNRGVYDAGGQMVDIGTILDVDSETIPAYLVNKAEIVEGSEIKGKRGKQPVTNPARYQAQANGEAFAIVDGSGVEVASLQSQEDVDVFNSMSDEDKAAFVSDQKKA